MNAYICYWESINLMLSNFTLKLKLIFIQHTCRAYISGTALLHRKNTSLSRTPLNRRNASVLLKNWAISELLWQHRADVRWPTLWDTFLSILTLFIHRFKPSIHRCNPPSHRIPQPYSRYPTVIEPLSHSHNSAILHP